MPFEIAPFTGHDSWRQTIRRQLKNNGACAKQMARGEVQNADAGIKLVW